ncbi:Serine/threonine protein kinase [Parasponia andersonii]|uniref:Serine/threonine protein kinase n=1 Tax=Parasponia andersonii TaxID=3476 RepID=A0A2P5BGE0_PARAD|nr:Serine/threonine protein kinase [Parasponia andersonii]
MVMILSRRSFLSVFKGASILIFPAVLLLVPAHGQSGFISIDCGTPDGSSYTDGTTGISYVSDTNFTQTGVNRNVSPEYKFQTKIQQFWNVQSFPEGTRNCYILKPMQGKNKRYLIRARFMYGNYDNLGHVPVFDLYLGVDLWDTVNLEFAGTSIDKEVIHVPPSDYIYVCLVNTGYGTPFISALELRPLDNQIYVSQSGTALQLFKRYDFGTTSNQATRYKDDVSDRLWSPFDQDTDSWTALNKSLALENSLGKVPFELPLAVLSTAYSPSGASKSSNMGFNWKPPNSTPQYYFYMHFAELQDISNNQSRVFNIFINGDLLVQPGPVFLDQVPLRMGTAYSSISDPVFTPDSEGKFQVWINRTENSTLPPLINAMEIYMVKQLSSQATNEKDVYAMLDIKSMYRITKNWQGDPCAPKAYLWDGVGCGYDANNPYSIKSLDLSSSGLKGEIAPYIINLTMLQHLDLSNNNLSGKVPPFLGQLSFLKFLNLRGNSFTGPVPSALLQRSKNGLSLSIDSYLYPSCSLPGSCQKKKSVVPVVVGSVCGVVGLITAVALLIWCHRRRRQRIESNNREKGSIVSKKQQFPYSEIQRITNNFESVLGEGGFGKVFHGYLNNNEVAVKMLSSSSLKLLLRVHHKNLTTLVGYCDEGTNIGLIYEYMAMGNLRSHLSGNNENVLTWEARLRIAIDTAQGLEYLHNGCKPPIIHRDVKSTNILLNEKFQAKLGDFGLSKIFPNEGGTHSMSIFNDTPGVSTTVAGTPGYLDPEYYVSNWLNEKSDVYSFGVVLLEIITGQPVLAKNRENKHIIQWVNSMLVQGDVKKILDPRIKGDFDVNTVWKTVEISMACVAPSSSARPTMSRVAIELKDCLTTELSTRKDVSSEAESKDYSVEMISRTMITALSPQAR